MERRFDLEKIRWLLVGIQKVLGKSVIAAAILGAMAFFFSRTLLLALVRHVHVQLYYFNLSEVFFSSVEIAIYSGVFLTVPVIIVLTRHQFRHALRERMLHSYVFALFAVILFYLGSVFCYVVVLPSGIGFLLSFEGGVIKAMMSTERFVRFCVTMIFAFGAAFELPLVLLLLGKLGFVTSRMLSRTRRYAILIIVVAASVITPTPDIYNMSLLAVPLYVLYEVGILLLWLKERNLTAKTKSV
jgi:sec-independent protein translocase protein TatC